MVNMHLHSLVLCTVIALATACNLTLSPQNTSSLKAAVDALGSVSSPVTICLGAGVILADETFDAANYDHSFIGAGRGLTIFDGMGERSVLSSSNAVFISMERLSVRNCSDSAIIVNGVTNLTDVEFYDNSGSDSGGAVLHRPFGTTSPLTVTDSVFYRNAAVRNGGAIDSANSDAQSIITNCEFYDNTCGDNGGAVFAKQVRMEACAFRNNSAGFRGTGRGGAVNVGGGPDPCLVLACNFTENRHLVSGSALSLFYGTADGCLFFRNSPTGAMAATGQPIVLVNNSNFTENVHSQGREDHGGAMFAFGDVEIHNSVVVSNTGILAGGLYHFGFGSAELHLYDTYIAFNTATSDELCPTQRIGGGVAARTRTTIRMKTKTVIFADNVPDCTCVSVTQLNDPEAQCREFERELPHTCSGAEPPRYDTSPYETDQVYGLTLCVSDADQPALTCGDGIVSRPQKGEQCDEVSTACTEECLCEEGWDFEFLDSADMGYERCAGLTSPMFYLVVTALGCGNETQFSTETFVEYLEAAMATFLRVPQDIPEEDVILIMDHWLGENLEDQYRSFNASECDNKHVVQLQFNKTTDNVFSGQYFYNKISSAVITGADVMQSDAYLANAFISDSAVRFDFAICQPLLPGEEVDMFASVGDGETKCLALDSDNEDDWPEECADWDSDFPEIYNQVPVDLPTDAAVYDTVPRFWFVGDARVYRVPVFPSNTKAQITVTAVAGSVVVYGKIGAPPAITQQVAYNEIVPLIESNPTQDLCAFSAQFRYPQDPENPGYDQAQEIQEGNTATLEWTLSLSNDYMYLMVLPASGAHVVSFEEGVLRQYKDMTFDRRNEFTIEVQLTDPSAIILDSAVFAASIALIILLVLLALCFPDRFRRLKSQVWKPTGTQKVKQDNALEAIEEHNVDDFFEEKRLLAPVVGKTADGEDELPGLPLLGAALSHLQEAGVVLEDGAPLVEALQDLLVSACDAENDGLEALDPAVGFPSTVEASWNPCAQQQTIPDYENLEVELSSLEEESEDATAVEGGFFELLGLKMDLPFAGSVTSKEHFEEAARLLDACASAVKLTTIECLALLNGAIQARSACDLPQKKSVDFELETALYRTEHGIEAYVGVVTDMLSDVRMHFREVFSSGVWSHNQVDALLGTYSRINGDLVGFYGMLQMTLVVLATGGDDVVLLDEEAALSGLGGNSESEDVFSGESEDGVSRKRPDFKATMPKAEADLLFEKLDKIEVEVSRMKPSKGTWAFFSETVERMSAHADGEVLGEVEKGDTFVAKYTVEAGSDAQLQIMMTSASTLPVTLLSRFMEGHSMSDDGKTIEFSEPLLSIREMEEARRVLRMATARIKVAVGSARSLFVTKSQFVNIGVNPGVAFAAKEAETRLVDVLYVAKKAKLRMKDLDDCTLFRATNLRSVALKFNTSVHDAAIASLHALAKEWQETISMYKWLQVSRIAQMTAVESATLADSTNFARVKASDVISSTLEVLEELENEGADLLDASDNPQHVVGGLAPFTVQCSVLPPANGKEVSAEASCNTTTLTKVAAGFSLVVVAVLKVFLGVLRTFFNVLFIHKSTQTSAESTGGWNVTLEDISKDFNSSWLGSWPILPEIWTWLVDAYATVTEYVDWFAGLDTTTFNCGGLVFALSPILFLLASIFTFFIVKKTFLVYITVFWKGRTSHLPTVQKVVAAQFLEILSAVLLYVLQVIVNAAGSVLVSGLLSFRRTCDPVDKTFVATVGEPLFYVALVVMYLFNFFLFSGPSAGAPMCGFLDAEQRPSRKLPLYLLPVYFVWVFFGALRRILLSLFGIWTKELVASHNIILQAGTNDVDSEDDDNQQEAVVRLVGKTGGLFWLFFPFGAWATKVQEAANDAIIFYPKAEINKGTETESFNRHGYDPKGLALRTPQQIRTILWIFSLIKIVLTGVASLGVDSAVFTLIGVLTVIELPTRIIIDVVGAFT